jgi:uncharacterized protein YdaU (DUF1376 family)
MSKYDNVEELCLNESFKVANREYGIDLKTYLSYRLDLVESKKCSDEFKAMVEENVRIQTIKDNHVKALRKQEKQEEKATSTMLKALVEQLTKRSKFLTNE